MIPSIRVVRSKITFVLLCFVVISVSIWMWNRKMRFTEGRGLKDRTIYERRGKVVILLSNQRSGSTFVGEFFNRFGKGFYLFEPLLPFTPRCDLLYEERLEFLKQASHCDFRDLPSSYALAQKVFHVKTHSECRLKRICAPGHHPTLLQRYSDLCHSLKENYGDSETLDVLKDPYGVIDKLNGRSYPLSGNKTCGLPLNLTLSSSLCYSAEVVAFKILRVCSLSALEGIAKRLKDMGSTVYVVELVRDPRAIVNSALKLELRRENIDQRLDTLCGRYRTNMQYVEEQTSDATGHDGIVASGRYLRVRYEDIASDPIKGASKIYSHVGMDLPRDVKDWIEESSVDPEKTIEYLKQLVKNETLSQKERENATHKLDELIRQRGSPYGTVRDSSKILNKWRRKLSLDLITRIQDKCSDVMGLLGYKLINSLEERNNLENQLW